MKPKFEKGDRVRIKDTHVTGEIINVARFAGVYLVLLDEVHTSLSFPEHKLEFANPIAAFLTRLQELLATFDAEIGVHTSSTIEGMPEGVMLTIYGVYPEIRMFYNMPLVKSDDVFDYDKD